MANDTITDEQLIETPEDAGSEESVKEEKMVPQAEMEEKIKARLKNHVARQQELETQLAQAQEQLSAQSASPPAPASPNTAIPPVAPIAEGAPTGGSPPLTQADLQSALNQQQVQAAHNYHQNSIQEMAKNDPEFKTLVEKTDGLKVPHEVAMHITNSLDKDSAHKVLKRLLTSTLDNAKMEAGAYKGMASGDWNDYQNWLQGVLKQNTPPQINDNSPDLSSLDKGDPESGQTAAQSAVDDFVKSSY